MKNLTYLFDMLNDLTCQKQERADLAKFIVARQNIR